MTSPRWMILLCFSLISVFRTGESLTTIKPPLIFGTGESLTTTKPSIIFGTGKSFTTTKPSKTVVPSSLAAIIAGMNKAIADLNASNKKLLAYKKGISCPCNASMIQACNNQRNLLTTCDSQLNSANAQRSSLQQQLNDLNSQLSSANAQRTSLQQQVTVLARSQNEAWQSFNGHLYYLSTTKADWQTSRDYCTSRGADLLIINDAAENDFVRGFNCIAWIGLYKEGSTWTWVDGSTLLPSVSYWAPEEPNNFGNREDRVAIGFNNNVNTWNDSPFSTINYWICEKKVV